LPDHRRPSFRLQSRSIVPAAVPGSRAVCRRLSRLGPAVPGPQSSRSVRMTRPMSDEKTATPMMRLPSSLPRIDPAPATAFGMIVILLFLGSLYSSNFLSPAYLLQQLKVASFLGVIATGMFIVILLGQIDLSVPWVVATGGMMSAAATAYGPAG